VVTRAELAPRMLQHLVDIGRYVASGVSDQNTTWQHQQQLRAATSFFKWQYPGWTTVVSDISIWNEHDFFSMALLWLFEINFLHTAPLIYIIFSIHPLYALFTAAPSLIFNENESEAVRDRAVLLFNVFSFCSAHETLEKYLSKKF